MKRNYFLSYNTIIIILSAMLIGVLIGRFCPQNVSIQIHSTIQKIYLAFHPNAKKDSKTIIMEVATKNSQFIPQNSIYEEPTKKENKFILFFKKVFKNKKNSDLDKTIFDKDLY